ncbi:MAG: response regulator [Acidobacteriia bacterium]|nr:response regulator [Terriglobia bacterium]
MTLWGKQKEPARFGSSVAQAAAAGTAREELLQIALRVLRERTHADRIGVWLSEAQGEAVFRGSVWDASQADTPAAWNRLSPEISPLRKFAVRGESVEQVLDGSPEMPVIGPLVGMQRALWVRVQAQGCWQGMILVASRRRQADFPRAAVESLAAELALALALEASQEQSGARHADLTFARRILTAAESGSDTDTLLRELAQEGPKDAGVGFLAVARLSEEDAGVLDFAWKSGDLQWTAQLSDEPLQSLWRRALETGRAVGSEPVEALPEGNYARWVALPLARGGRPLGVLVAGLRRGRSSLASLEWLELHAALAADLLARLRRREEERAREAAVRSRVEMAGEPLLLLNAGGQIVALSAGARRLLGEPAVQAGASFADLFRARPAPEPAQEVAAWIHAALGSAAGSLPPLEGELLSGARVRARTLFPLPEDLLAVALERPAAETGAPSGSLAEDQLLTLLEWVEQGVVLYDAEQHIRAMNSRFAQIAGLELAPGGRPQTLEALIEQVSPLAAEPETLARRWRELARMQEGGVREELQLARPVPRILERAARPVLDASGQCVGWLEIYRELTAQRIFQSRLLQAEKLAALGQMVGEVAHELSNPLTSILGYAQRLLLRRDAPQGEEVQKIYQEAERAGRILRQLLQSSREVRPERKRVSLNAIVLRALELQRLGMPAGQIRVETELDPAAPQLIGDPDQLQQVVMNLVANAQQAIEHSRGRGVIRVTTRRTRERRVRLEVADDGPGIPAALLARIFDPFFTTKPPGLGTGLGLAIVLSVVREHGGQVHVTNRAGGGALFSVDLPLAEQEAAGGRVPAMRKAPGAPPSERQIAAGPPEAPAGTRVLIVEDEPTVANLLAEVLRDEGMTVEALLDGREALARAAQRRYDLVICDLKMPGLGGQQFYEALASAGSPLRDRVIFVTGDPLSTKTLEFFEHHRLPYVPKPFRVEELLQTVRGVLQQRAAVISKQATARHSS